MRIFLTNAPAHELPARLKPFAYQPEILSVTRGFEMPIQLPQWTEADGKLLDPTLFDKARKIVALYKGAGHGNPFAFGMLGCAEGENNDLSPNGLGDYLDGSGKRLPWAAHPTGTPSSFGLYMRKEPRTAAIRDGRKDGAGKIIFEGLGFDIKTLAILGQNTLENEVKSVLWELAAFPLGYGAGPIFAAKTAYGVAVNATITFERAGTVANGEAERRGSMAEAWVALASGVWPRMRGPQPAEWKALTEGW